MFATTKLVKLSSIEVLCMDMTYGFVLGLEDGSIQESPHVVVANGTTLSEDEILGLRGSEVELLYSEIVKLTYPMMYNEDGSLKEQKGEPEETSKKKV